MLFWAFLMTVTFMVVELVGGVLSSSLALLADAGHMATDAMSMALALFAIWMAKRPVAARLTYGYNRAEILAAGVNALSLWAIAAWILWEAAQRFAGWRDVEIEGGVVLIVGGAGLLVNFVVAYMLHGFSAQSLNVEGALQHVIADIMGSLGMLISGVIIIVFDHVEWIVLVDPIISVLIVLLILLSSWHLVRSVLIVLMEGVPDDLDMYRLCSDIEDVPGVTIVHDVHAWTVTSGFVSLTAHVLVDADHPGDHDDILRDIRRVAAVTHGIAHTTIQIETSARGCSEDHHVDHLFARSEERRVRRLPSVVPRER